MTASGVPMVPVSNWRSGASRIQTVRRVV